ncbi:MAG: peptidoglycan D,D-transpeptidase FtsI family protein [Actinomycetota bacterium]
MTRPVLRRAGTLGAALLICLFLVGVRLTYVQAVRSEQYAEEGRRQRIRKIELPARRGAIYDRLGSELAVSIPARTVYANPRHVKDPAQTARALAPLLGRSAAALENDLRKDRSFVYLARRIGVVSTRKVTALRLSGIGVLDEPRRLYPGGSLAAGVLGFIGTDQRGLAGLEYGYEELLRGTPGHRILEQDPQGRRIPQGTFAEVSPEPGSDLVLTLHADLQFTAEDSLKRAIERTHANGGTVVAMDPRSGEILAMVSLPTYDPNRIGDIDPSTTKNRVVTDAFEPGSVNKVIAASAVLNEKLFGAQQQMWIPAQMKIGDKVFTEKRGSRSLDLRGILAQSSNLGSIRLAQMLGSSRLGTYFHRFGYGRGTGLGFPGESAGNLPATERWVTSLPTMAIGQGLSVTPLQLAQVYATLANDGLLVDPRLVSGWVDARGEMHPAQEPRRRRIISSEVAASVRDMLTAVVSTAEGTGVAARIPGASVAGKTGTASRLIEGVGYRGYMASFFGMFPAEAPELVIGVVLDNPVPSEGGLAAAPVFAEVGAEAVRILRIRTR